MKRVAKDRSPKIVDTCSPSPTGEGVVDRIITDLAVIDVTESGLVLHKLAAGVTEEDEVRSQTGAALVVQDPVTSAT